MEDDAQQGENGDQAGGWGDSPAAHPTTLHDVRMLERAVREQWDIPAEAFKVLPKELFLLSVGMRKNKDGEVETITDHRGRPLSPYAKIRAMRTLALMHGQNQRDDPATQQVEHEHRFASDADAIRRFDELVKLARSRRDAARRGEAPAIEGNGSG